MLVSHRNSRVILKLPDFMDFKCLLLLPAKQHSKLNEYVRNFLENPKFNQNTKLYFRDMDENAMMRFNQIYSLLDQKLKDKLIECYITQI